MDSAIMAVIVGVVFSGVAFLINISVFKAIASLETSVKEIFELLRKEIPTKEDCKRSKEERDRLSAESTQQGKYISRFDERLHGCEKNIENIHSEIFKRP
jgi:hypothetical protein